MTTNSKSQSFAAGANLVAIVCASVSFLTMAIALFQIFTGHNASISAYAVMICTLPVTIICTVIALMLVGVRLSKLALIAIGIFALQFIMGYIAKMILMHQ
jgi:hypothetical protein